MLKKFAFIALAAILAFSASALAAEPEAELEPLTITSEAAILMDASTGIVLYGKNIDKMEYPASITKVMTALLTLESAGSNLDRRIFFTEEALENLPWDSSSIGMNIGDSLSVDEALHGLLLNSANEVANALAVNLGLTYDAFIDRMNAKAQELGAKNTHFVNPHGLHDDKHYTSVYDMALFMREAAKNQTFRELISTRHYNIPPTETQSEIRPLNNSNKLIQPGQQFYNEFVIGGKTGYTDEARHTLASIATKDGITLIAVVMRGEKNVPYAESTALFEYGFKEFHEATLLVGSDLKETANVIQDRENPSLQVTIGLRSTDVIEGLYPVGVTRETVTLEADIPDEIYAPIRKGDPLGSLRVVYGDVTVGTVKLFASESVAQPEKVIPAWISDATPLAPELPASTAPAIAQVNSFFSLGFAGNLIKGALDAFGPKSVNMSLIVGIIGSLAFLTLIIVFVKTRRRPDEKELLREINKKRRR
ncbi:MAG: D-alanyl-D-alanine carboxypeptidase [Clostridiales bacterium]|jgi:D-alanyl-D-alanine carboxypeptidase|nr:D-alanyl-D-alanine carboxypeptidase [Clostridiales bacterium]